MNHVKATQRNNDTGTPNYIGRRRAHYPVNPAPIVRVPGGVNLRKPEQPQRVERKPRWQVALNGWPIGMVTRDGIHGDRTLVLATRTMLLNGYDKDQSVVIVGAGGLGRTFRARRTVLGL